MTTTDERLEQAASLTESWTQQTNEPEPDRLDVYIAADEMLDAVAALHGAGWGYLAAITGLDTGETDELEVLYHFCGGAAVFTLRVRLPRENPTISTVCNVIPSASMFERELSEMFGIRVEGTPDESRLFLPDDWEAGVYPLRKDFAQHEDGKGGDES